MTAAADDIQSLIANATAKDSSSGGHGDGRPMRASMKDGAQSHACQSEIANVGHDDCEGFPETQVALADVHGMQSANTTLGAQYPATVILV